MKLDVPVELAAGTVELVLVVAEPPAPNGSKYDFAGVAGRLDWQGDALAEQGKLRDGL